MGSYGDKLIKLGLNIAYYRHLRQLTQEQLAEKVGVSRSHISRIEAANVYESFSFALLFKISDVLEIPESKLMEFRD